ncbi:MAG: tetratricopeptide repeat protein [Firmicutes bacterium]|nr:tetratricopeptide repeat protein [Bacillota bacterium]MCM1401840.1 tetratricopeptide repeat protein [Bacteroides sp.]MCM1477725.1 tetratricopeptide repeat protein [Bacteroides sp.]
MARIALLLSLIFPILALAKTTDSIPSTLKADYVQLVEDADKAIADMKWTDAIDLLDRAMRLDPANPSNVLLLSNKGMLQYYNGADSASLETLTIAHNIAPASVTVLQNRAKVFTSAGRLGEALADYSTIISLDSTLVEPWFYRAMINFRAGKQAEALADINEMKRRFPESSSTTLAEATYLTFTGQFNEAIPLLSKIIEEKPTAADYSSRALCYLMTGQLPEASDDIAHGLELDPTDGELYLYRALLNKMRYRPDDAKADAEKARLYGVSSERVKALML